MHNFSSQLSTFWVNIPTYPERGRKAPRVWDKRSEILSLLNLELEARRQRAIERRFRLSRLQAQLSIDSFDFHHHKSRMQSKSRILRLLDLICWPPRSITPWSANSSSTPIPRCSLSTS